MCDRKYRNYPKYLNAMDEVEEHREAIAKEKLIKPSEVASELAYRDIIIKNLRAENKKLKAK